MKIENKNRSQLIKEADKWFSLYIRARDKKKYNICPLCLEEEIQHCFHWISRRHQITRWNEFNASGSCAGCNFNMNYDPAHFYAWFEKKYPGRLQRLVSLSHKPYKVDLIKVINKFKKRYNQLNNSSLIKDMLQ